jgi:PKD repeat protein
MRHTFAVLGLLLFMGAALSGCLGSVSSNEKPSISMSISPSGTVKVGDEVTFDATGSSDDGGSLTYDWDFGDGQTSTAMTVKHTFTTEGTFTVELCISDGDLETCEERQLTVASADAVLPTASITSYKDDDCTGDGPGSGTHILAWICEEEKDSSDTVITATTTIQLDGSPSSAGDSSEYLTGYSWDLNVNVDSDSDGDAANDEDLTGETAEWTNVGPGEYSIRLTVTDSQGFTDTDDMDIYINYHGIWAEFTIDGNNSNNAVEVEFGYPVGYDSDTGNTMRYVKIQLTYPQEDDDWVVGGGQSSNRLDVYAYNATGEEVANSTYLGDDDRTAGDCSDQDRCVELRLGPQHFRNYLEGDWTVDMVNEKFQDTTVKSFAILLEYK